MAVEVITVSELNSYLKKVVDNDRQLKDLQVCGEISNFYYHSSSGHMYFTLKDDKSCIDCVFFRSRNSDLKFQPEDGMQVVALGSVSIYEKKSSYQLYLKDLLPDGIGALYVAFEQLKEKLFKEGLFNEEEKASLPFLPQCIGLVTSPNGAAVRDILTVLKRRFPNLKCIISPATVQGENASRILCDALLRLYDIDEVEVIIIARGGGSFESLWCFNDEELARTIYSSPVPVISAVGHETDFTICDYTADYRAPTPSAAAEVVVPEYEELIKKLKTQRKSLKRNLKNQLNFYQSKLQQICKSKVLTQPLDLIENYYQYLDELSKRLVYYQGQKMTNKRDCFLKLSGKLDALSPLKTLKRGYSVLQTPETRSIIKSINQIKKWKKVEVLVSDGRIGCTVNQIWEGEQFE